MYLEFLLKKGEIIKEMMLFLIEIYYMIFDSFDNCNRMYVVIFKMIMEVLIIILTSNFGT